MKFYNKISMMMLLATMSLGSNANSMSLDNLPQELQEEILKKLDVKDAYKMRQVSQKWNRPMEHIWRAKKREKDEQDLINKVMRSYNYAKLTRGVTQYLDLSNFAERFGTTLTPNLLGTIIQNIPQKIKRQLRNLNLENNQLTSLPMKIGQLKLLTNLNLANNQLELLPRGISLLKQLRNLNVANNQLRSLPEQIGMLALLRNLNLADNQLKSLPEQIGLLRSLTDLNIANNQLESLPIQIALLKKLESLFLLNAFKSTEEIQRDRKIRKTINLLKKNTGNRVIITGLRIPTEKREPSRRR